MGPDHSPAILTEGDEMSTHTAVREWTYDEFSRLPDDGNRYEVIAGELYVTPAPGKEHQIVSARFNWKLRGFATVQHQLGEVLYAPIDVLLGDGEYLQPDLVFLRRDHEHYWTRRGIEGPPDLVIEVLSPSTASRDRVLKRDRYARFGVPEYWIIDAKARHVEIYRRDDPHTPVVVTSMLRWQPVEGGPVLELDVSELLGGLG
jgi:Uma2 family endonuclease